MTSPRATAPLAGVTVLDFSTVLAGPFATMLLGDLGADVLKIETLPDGDEMRQMPPYFTEEGESAYFVAVNRNKQSVAINLRTAEGRDTVRALARTADVVYCNMKPPTYRKLGLDYAHLGPENPRLVCCNLSGFGAHSAFEDRPAYDLVVQALSGAMSVNGFPGRPPARLGVSMGDLAGSLYSVLGVLAALYQRGVTGHGQEVDVALLDSLVSLMTYLSQYSWIGGYVPQPMGSSHATSVPYETFATADGYIVVDAHSERHWPVLCELLEDEVLAGERFATMARRLEGKDELIGRLQERFLERTAAEWLSHPLAAEVPMAAVRDIPTALADEHLRAREMVRTVQDAEGRAMRFLGSPLKFSDAERSPLRVPPRFAEHTVAVLRERLELGADEIDALQRAGAIATGAAAETDGARR